MCEIDDEILDDYERDRLAPTPIDELLEAEWQFYIMRLRNNLNGGYHKPME